MPRGKSGERIVCEHCDPPRDFAKAHYGNHIRQQHNIFGGISGRPTSLSAKRRQQLAAAERMRAAKVLKKTAKATPRKAAKKPSKVPTTAVEVYNGDQAPRHLPAPTSPSGSLHMQVLPFVVLESQDGGIWIAERVR